MDYLYEKYKNLGDYDLHDALVKACSDNLLEDVKFLLTSNDLKVKVDIHHFNERPLMIACAKGYLEIVKYLLTSPELSEKADIKADNHYPLIQACLYGHLDVVKFLLTSPDLQERSDLHIYDDEPFKIAMQENYSDFLRFFIFDLNIPKSKEIELDLKQKPNELVENMFSIREKFKDLNQDLNTNLINKSDFINKKVKL